MQIGQETQLEIQGTTYTVLVKSIQGDEATVVVDGEEVTVRIQAGTAEAAPAPRPVAKPAPAPAAAPAAPPKAAAPTGSAPVGTGGLTANMPGVVVKLLVEEGQEVKTQDVVLVLEAMKMENEIRAGRDGSVAAIHVQAGQRVQTGDPLISWK